MLNYIPFVQFINILKKSKIKIKRIKRKTKIQKSINLH